MNSIIVLAVAIIIAAVIIVLGYGYITAANSLGCQFGATNCIKQFFIKTTSTTSITSTTATTTINTNWNGVLDCINNYYTATYGWNLTWYYSNTSSSYYTGCGSYPTYGRACNSSGKPTGLYETPLIIDTQWAQGSVKECNNQSGSVCTAVLNCYSENS